MPRTKRDRTLKTRKKTGELRARAVEAVGVSSDCTDGLMSSSFEELCKLALASAGDVSAAGRNQIIEDLRLRFDYGDNYVAYVDRFPFFGKTRKLHRTIIAISRDLREIHQILAKCRGKDRRNVMVEFVDPIGDDLMVPHNLADR